ncbi:AT8B1 ATPase, partial [Amia calva]|nr:AT8B1 ATPase [Amia calva]
LPWEVRANDRSFHQRLQKRSLLCLRWGRYADNVMRSHKYTLLSFLPLNLFEQFQRAANIYFLLMVILQSVPAVSTLPWYTTMVPLLMVLSVRAGKDLAADLARRRSDREINNRPCAILTRDSVVGDVVRLQKDAVIPADLLLLRSSEPHSLCYVETADIDGETNLKFRQAVPITHQELESESSLPAFQVRGCVLRNTDTAYGLALYTGADTKILQNSGRFLVKKSHVELLLNRAVIAIVLLLLGTALLLAVGAGVSAGGVWGSSGPLAGMWWGQVPVYTAFLTFWGYIILLGPAMPMALYITFEVIHLLHSLLISWDLEMYEEKRYSRHDEEARGETLQRLLLRERERERELYRTPLINVLCDLNRSSSTPTPLSLSSPSQERQQFSDPRLKEQLRSRRCPEVWEFCRALALCHTVMVEWKDGTPVFQAASPDEEALVGAAQGLGWVFQSRTRDSISLDELGRPRLYKLLTILDFSSQRRRMSVLVREPEGGLKLYCKGADTAVLERLREDCPHREDAEVALQVFSESCLRTLCVAMRPVTEASWEQWSQALQLAAMKTHHSDDQLEVVYDSMERELTLLGVTAIEDRLQEGVPETIASLQQAGIKVWMLTGDKRETAVNIGYSCRLLDSNSTILQGDELRELLQSPELENTPPPDKTESWWGKQRGGSNGSKTALVITGPELSLTHTHTALYEWCNILHLPLCLSQLELGRAGVWGTRFMSLAQQCQSVLCCRVTPGQKAGVVQLVRKHTRAVTMAIGDGANDVNMIKTAHVGVGVSGVEGCQAVQCSDFSLPRFRCLRRLLLVHGRWSYHRVTRFLRYFLFKTTSFALVHTWFSFFNGFSAQPMYENWFITLYTVLYTALPIFCLAVLEQDVSAEVSLRCPQLYRVGQAQQLFNPWLLGATLLHSLYASLVLFFLPLGVFSDSALDYQTLAVTVGTSAIFTATAEIVLQTGFWTRYNVWALCLSLVLYFLVTFLLHSPRFHQAAPLDYYFPGVAVNALSNPLVWLTVLLTGCMAVLPSLTSRALGLVLRPPDTHRVHSSDRSVSLGTVEMRSGFQRGSSQRCSSYALSQGRGFGKLLNSGASLRSTVPQQDGRGTAGTATPEKPQT